jgi:hypothetical protein
MFSTRKALASLIAAVSLGGPATPAARAGETSDFWWDPQESGWGMNVVQQGEVAFVTLFVYGPDGRPTWYFSDAHVFALGDGGRPALRGTLYRARGPWLGGPFDPAQVAIEPAGSLVVEPRQEGRLYLEYVAEGVKVQKSLARMSFAVPEVAASHHGSFSLRLSAPGGPSWGVRRFSAEVYLEIANGEAFLRVQEGGAACHYRGPYHPSGRYATVRGQYACGDGEAGTFEISELELTKHGLSGYLRTFGAATNQAGRFAAARH